jgi:chemotaxis signal transduction protein
MSERAGVPDALLPIEVGGRMLALDALAVVEILGVRPWIAIPRAPSAVPGAIAWRGRALALLEVGPALGLPAIAEPNSRSRNLVVRIADDTVVLGADRVLEACRPSEPATNNPAIEFELPRLGEFVLGDSLVCVLDLETWVRSCRRSA